MGSSEWPPCSFGLLFVFTLTILCASTLAPETTSTSSVHPSTVASTVGRDPCEHLRSVPQKYLLPTPAAGATRCYFVVSGSTSAANQRSADGSKYEFNVDQARETCKIEGEGATLPVINTPQDEAALLAYVDELVQRRLDGLTNSTSDAALGLRQEGTEGNYTYKWDDDSDFSYTSPVWNRNDYAEFTIASVEGKWQNIANNTVDHVVAVVCQTFPVATVTETTQATPDSVCHMADRSAYQLTRIRTSDFSESCFFIVKNAIAQANPESNGTYVFNKTAAENICKQHKATLLDIRYADENLLFAHMFSKWLEESEVREYFELGADKVALGIHQRKNTTGFYYEWDNGSDLSFAYQSDWPTKYTLAAYTQLELGTGQWINEPLTSTGTEKPVLVVCQQRLWMNPMESELYSKCSYGRPEDYIHTAVYKNKHCYFYHKELDIMSRPREGSLFDVGAAREWCLLAGGELPKLENEEEEKWIKEQFSAHVQESDIALGLRQVKHELDYWWSEKRQLRYAKSNWPTKDKYAYFTSMSLSTDQLAWTNVPSPNTSVRVLCEQENIERESACHGDRADVENPMVFDNESCYFLVAGGVQQANDKTSKGFVFKAEKARGVCSRHHATLATISRRQEHEFLVSNYLSFVNGLDDADIALGLKRNATSYKYEWDDDTEYKHEAVWPTKYDFPFDKSAFYTIASLRYWNETPYVEWANVADGHETKNPVYVVCKQPHGGIKPTPTISPLVLSDNRCDGQTRPEIYDWKASETHCYFVVTGATTRSNRIIGHNADGSEKIAFDISIAREICHDHAATLPILADGHELEWVVDSFLSNPRFVHNASDFRLSPPLGCSGCAAGN